MKYYVQVCQVSSQNAVLSDNSTSPHVSHQKWIHDPRPEGHREICLTSELLACHTLYDKLFIAIL